MINLRHDEIVKQDQNLEARRQKMVDGSKALCAAILRTGKLYKPMSQAAQVEAIEYAYNVTARIHTGFVR